MRIAFVLLNLLLATAIASGPAALAADATFTLAAPDCLATILVPTGEPNCVVLAAGDLAGDVEAITGRRPAIVRQLTDSAADCVLLASVDRPESARLLNGFAPKLNEEIAGQWETYRVRTVAAKAGPVRRALVIAGSNERGTMFGLYAFLEQCLQVDPLYFWADRPPQPRDRLAFAEVHIAAAEPTFRYRGWFINDEDLLSEWRLDGGKRDIDYPFYEQVVSPAVSARVFEALLRLQHNLVIPASFVDIRNPDEARLIDEATRRGLFVSMHHVEPMGVSGFGFLNYWRDHDQEVPFSYTRHPDKFALVWEDYARRWAEYPNVIWQIGLRGIADRPVWASDTAAPESEAERGQMIASAMKKQWEIIRRVDPRPDPPITTTLWMEGSRLHHEGHLNFPPGVAVIFSDNSPGWQLQPDFYEVQREQRRPYGVYYHQQLWGSGPHLVQGVSPRRMYDIFRQVVDRGSTHYAITNVGNVREFVLGVDAAARMLRDFDGFDPDRFLTDWCRQHFDPAAEAAERAYRKFFDSYVDDESAGRREQLDGETLHSGRRFLEQMIAGLEGGKSKPFSSPDKIRQRLTEVRRHRAALELAGAEIDPILNQLAGTARRFFETNFVAQYKIFHGLLTWFEHTLESGLALADGQSTQALEELREAQSAFVEIRAGQALASRGPFENWYRGDRKMNLDGAEELTDKAIQKLVSSDRSLTETLYPRRKVRQKPRGIGLKFQRMPRLGVFEDPFVFAGNLFHKTADAVVVDDRVAASEQA
ncbi:MAG: hypothetical protein GXY83_27035 [Rhodopirellula sp.]|nr:hypothetical protein [Rhodopirellula sp.]